MSGDNHTTQNGTLYRAGEGFFRLKKTMKDNCPPAAPEVLHGMGEN